MRGRTARNSSETCAELVGDLRGHFQKIPENSRKICIARNSCSAIFSREANWFELICSGSMSCAQVSRSFKSFRLVLKPTHFVLNVFWFLFWFWFWFFVFLSVFLFFCLFFFFNTKFSNLISLYKLSIFGRLCALFGVPLAPNHIVCLSLINLYSLDSWHYRTLCQEILWRLVNILYFPQIFKDGGTKIPLSAYYAFLLWLELLWLE